MEVTEDIMKTIKSIWGQALALPHAQIKPKDNFFDIGGNSVLAFKVMALLRQAEPKFNDVDPLLLFKFPVLELFVEALSQTGNPDQAPTASIIDFAAELQLPPSEFTSKESGGRGILITGTTGYFGPHLLMNALKEYTDNTFFCIIRAGSDEEAKKRLKVTLEPYSQRGLLFGFDRVHCLAGDLTKPHFGLSDDVYSSLLENVAVIFHAAADVSFTKTYEQLRETTVAMTKNILLFAREGLKKEVHYMSTTGVFDGVEERRTRLYFEALEDKIPREVDPNRMSNGYFQSKWVSEKLVRAAATNLPVSIYRIGQIGAHGMTKQVKRRDVLAGFIIACHRLGIYPSMDMKLPFVDADVAASTIVTLSEPREHEWFAFHTYHVVSREIGMKDFFEGKEGKVNPVSLDNWEEEFGRSVMAELKTEDDINAWLFLRMLKDAEAKSVGNGKSLLKNVTFFTVETQRGTRETFVKTVEPTLYADLLINLANKE